MKIKTVVLGDRAVGKTYFVQHLNGEIKSTSYHPTIAIDFTEYSKSGTLMHIWDTSGLTKYMHIVRTFMRGSSLFIIVFNDQRSLDKVEMYIETIRTIAQRDHRIILLSLSTDVTTEAEGQMIACQHKLSFFHCNVHNRENVLRTWHEIMYLCEREVREHNWRVDDMNKKNTEIVNINATTNYRFCWWF